MNRRKLKKLIESPERFFRDAIDKRAWRIRSKIPRKSHASARRFSVVTAVYNAEPYLDEFLGSLVRQSVRFGSDIELLAVDDGSTDGSLSTLRRWAERHPDAIKVLHKPNGGQASARNLGLEHATGDWVTFIDPDDFVSTDYFEQVERLLSRHDADGMTFVSCNLILYHERKQSIRDTHSLKFRFAQGDRAVRSVDFDRLLLHLSAASAFFRRDLVESHHLRFDEAIRPVFEDAHFVARYLLAHSPECVGVCASARYYYRKRADESSTMDRAWQTHERFTTLLRNAHLQLLGGFDGSGERPPVWLQRTVLYDLAWYFRRVVDHSETTALLSGEQLESFREVVRQILIRIDASVIQNFDLCGMWLFYKIGLLRFAGYAIDVPLRAYIDGYDETTGLVRVRHFHAELAGSEVVRSQVEELELVFEKTQRHDFAGATFVEERILWLRLPSVDARISMRFGPHVVQLVLKKRRPAESVTGRNITMCFAGKPRPYVLPWYRRVEHELVTSSTFGGAFRDCWLFLDRDTQADDNAEHLYRYVRSTRPDINAFFVLRRSSHDWKRLERDGFRLLEFGGAAHRAALANARHVISSHVDRYVVSPMPDLDKSSLRRFKATFLQHGVTHHDISSWLNPKPLDLLITASPREHRSIVADGSPYRYCDREVALTGFPRHDALFRAERDAEPTVLTLMPTWRLSLAGRVKGDGNEREKNPDFARSRFAREWTALLRSNRLRDLRDHGYQIDFFPHANLSPYIDELQIPPHVSVKTHVGGSIQDVFRRTAVLVTDYSSTAFELAYLRRPVVYFQFDRDEVYGGGHLTRPGYFDHYRDGFGPVCTTVDEVTDQLERITSRGNQAEPEYAKRMEEVFAYRDGRACERVLAAIEALDAPVHPRAQTEQLRLTRARRASSAGLWQSAAERWSSVVEPSLERDLCLAQAHRELGHFVSSARTLSRLPSDSPDVRRERARLLSSVGDWENAIPAWQHELDEAGPGERSECALQLAIAFAATTQHQRALETLEPHRTHGIQHARVYAEAASALGEWQIARDALANLAPYDAELALMQAEAAYRSGDREGALAMLRRPPLTDDANAQRMLVRLGELDLHIEG